MGINDRKLDEKDNRRAKQKEARSRRTQQGEGASWDTCDWLCIVALVKALGEGGGALRLGTTRDGNAFAFGVYLNDDYATEYIRPAENFEVALGEIATAWLPDRGVKYQDFLIELRAGKR